MPSYPQFNESKKELPTWLRDVAIRVDELVRAPSVMDHFWRMLREWSEWRARRGPKLSVNKPGRITGGFPTELLPDRAMRLPEKYATLSAIHDAVCAEQAKHIDPWRKLDRKRRWLRSGARYYIFLRMRVKDLTDDDQARIKGILDEVCADLDRQREHANTATRKGPSPKEIEQQEYNERKRRYAERSAMGWDQRIEAEVAHLILCRLRGENINTGLDAKIKAAFAAEGRKGLVLWRNDPNMKIRVGDKLVSGDTIVWPDGQPSTSLDGYIYSATVDELRREHGLYETVRLTARELARDLGVPDDDTDVGRVASVLYRLHDKGLVTRDDDNRWRVVEQPPQRNNDPTSEPPHTPDIQDYRTADWILHEHGIVQSRLSEAAADRKVRQQPAPKGTLDSQGRKVWILYHEGDALKYCSPKHVTERTRRKPVRRTS